MQRPLTSATTKGYSMTNAKALTSEDWARISQLPICKRCEGVGVICKTCGLTWSACGYQPGITERTIHPHHWEGVLCRECAGLGHKEKA